MNKTDREAAPQVISKSVSRQNRRKSTAFEDQTLVQGQQKELSGAFS